MSKRLQVLLDDEEYRAIARLARSQDTTVAAWVREALRDARARRPTRPAADKLRVVRAAARHEYPTAGIDQMLEEIEGGYAGTIG